MAATVDAMQHMALRMQWLGLGPASAQCMPHSCSDGGAAGVGSTGVGCDSSATGGDAFTFAVDDLQRLRRGLILGAVSSCYTASATTSMLSTTLGPLVAQLCCGPAGIRVVEEIVTLAVAGRAPKQDTLLFALAVVARQSDDQPTRRAAFAAISTVCGTPTQLFSFLAFFKQWTGVAPATTLYGWGRGLRRGVCAWYTARPALRVAFLATKFGSRCGWTHHDVFRLCHLAADGPSGLALTCRFLVHGAESLTAAATNTELARDTADAAIFQAGGVCTGAGVDGVFSLLTAVVAAKATTEAAPLIRLIRSHALVREHCPTALLHDPEVWEALLVRMPLMALLRNLGKLTSVGVFGLPAGITGLPGVTAAPLSAERVAAVVELVCGRLTCAKAVVASKVHPVAVLTAMRQYDAGAGDKGSLSWFPTPRIQAALEACFMLAFKAPKPTGQRVLIGLDVSGSMVFYGCAAMPALSCREAAAAMLMVQLRTEPTTTTVMAFSNGFVSLPLTAATSLEATVAVTAGLQFDTTDCARPMLWALQQQRQVDAFIIYTDNDTNCGSVSPADALRQYRVAMQLPHTRLVVVAMTDSPFTIADPADPGMLDVVGFDAATPALIAAFIAGEL
jgi:60 kDa SS-A/Ro ribonucleoprotein